MGLFLVQFFARLTARYRQGWFPKQKSLITFISGDSAFFSRVLLNIVPSKPFF